MDWSNFAVPLRYTMTQYYTETGECYWYYHGDIHTFCGHDAVKRHNLANDAVLYTDLSMNLVGLWPNNPLTLSNEWSSHTQIMLEK